MHEAVLEFLEEFFDCEDANDLVDEDEDESMEMAQPSNKSSNQLPSAANPFLSSGGANASNPFVIWLEFIERKYSISNRITLN